MKEVTRIHIAKTVYNVEVDAKKELEKYMKDLERYANDAEILTDIEIRITELLAERGVQKDGIITMGDVVAIRKQLGEPKDFAEDGEVELDSATVNNLEASANNGEVSAGVVKNLNVAQPDSCPDRDNTENSVEVADVTGEFIYNGEKQSPGNLENPCGIVKINSKEDEQ